MSQAGRVLRVASNPATQFRAGVAQNAAAYLPMNAPAGQYLVRGVNVQSAEGITWDVWFYHGQPTGGSISGAETIGSSVFAGKQTFAAAGTQIGAAGLFYASAMGLGVYLDIPFPPPTGANPPPPTTQAPFTVALIPRSGAKAADDAGAVRLELLLEPTHEW